MPLAVERSLSNFRTMAGYVVLEAICLKSTCLHRYSEERRVFLSISTSGNNLSQRCSSSNQSFWTPSSLSNEKNLVSSLLVMEAEYALTHFLRNVNMREERFYHSVQQSESLSKLGKMHITYFMNTSLKHLKVQRIKNSMGFHLVIFPKAKTCSIFQQGFFNG